MHEEIPKSTSSHGPAASSHGPAAKTPEETLHRQERKEHHGIEAVAVAGGAATGAMVGAAAGPPGAIAGAVVGGVIGALSCVVLDREVRRQEEDHLEQDRQSSSDDDVISRRATARKEKHKLDRADGKTPTGNDTPPESDLMAVMDEMDGVDSRKKT